LLDKFDIMLVLIGLGLFDEKDLSIRGIEEARSSDRVFIELYTSYWHGDLKKLEEMIGKKVEILERKDLEEECGRIIEMAKKQKVVILVQGDPLTQTTHAILLKEAMERGIETRVVHNASSVSAIGETGLHLQKFGRYVTIPFLEKTKGELPFSVYEIIRENRERGLHTLCLLDVIAEEEKYMRVSEALQILLMMEEERKEGVLRKDDKVVVCCKLGAPTPKIMYGTVEKILEISPQEIPALIIIPSDLHFTEKELLNFYSIENV